MPKLSVTVITKNEAANLAAALESVAWADEIVVVDAESTDDTAAIARRFTDRVVVRPGPGFRSRRTTRRRWPRTSGFCRSTPTSGCRRRCGARFRRCSASEPSAPGYRVARVTFALGRWIRTTDWYPDWQLRLYDRRRGRWDETRRVHEAVRVDGEAGRLAGELQHFAYRDLSHHLQTIDRYTTLAAEDMAARGRRASLLEMAGHPPLAFLRNYLLRGGVRDGAVGLVISSMNAWYVFLKYAKLWELGPPRCRSRRGAGRRSPVITLHIDTGRTWRGGQNQALLTVLGLRSRGHRTVLVAHPARRAAAARVGRARSDPARAAIRARSRRGVAARPHPARAAARDRPCPRPARRGDGGHRARLRRRTAAIGDRARTAAGRLAARRLRAEAERVLALEVPSGRALHLRLRVHSPDAARAGHRR